MSKSIQQNMDYGQQLQRGALHLGIELGDHQVTLLLRYLELLQKWNRAYNLTAIREPAQMVSRHLLDSLSIIPWINGNKILDVGTGPGLPGIPAAIMFPEKEFHLLDSNGKKTRFLTQCKIELGLTNISVHHQRIEQHSDNGVAYDQILSRAFASLVKMVDLCEPYLATDGQFLAMKGLEPNDEMAIIRDRYSIIKTISLDVPESDGARHLIIIGRHDNRADKAQRKPD